VKNQVINQNNIIAKIFVEMDYLLMVSMDFIQSIVMMAILIIVICVIVHVPIALMDMAYLNKRYVNLFVETI